MLKNYLTFQKMLKIHTTTFILPPLLMSGTYLTTIIKAILAENPIKNTKNGKKNFGPSPPPPSTPEYSPVLRTVCLGIKINQQKTSIHIATQKFGI